MRVIFEEFEGEIFIEIYLGPSDRKDLERGKLVLGRDSIGSYKAHIAIVPSLRDFTNEEDCHNHATEEGEI